MRADRLISMLILLQLRGRLTAEELAAELEVSTRTVYRDLQALDAAGVPIFTESGPGGGCGLEEAYRTSLTGLTTEEVQALFMLSIPNALYQLGVGPELKAAFLKLAASLPTASRHEEDRTRQRIHIDSTTWFHSDHPVPCLRSLHQAIWRDEHVRLRLRLPFSTEAELEVAPYGLVAKADTWYLVSQQLGRWRVDPVADVLEVTLTGRPFQRAENFLLTAFWNVYCRTIEADRATLHVHIRVKPELLDYFPQFLGNTRYPGVQNYPVDADGWFLMEIDFENMITARRQLLGYGGAVEVLAPRQLRLSLQDFAAQILNLYGSPQPVKTSA